MPAATDQADAAIGQAFQRAAAILSDLPQSAAPLVPAAETQSQLGAIHSATPATGTALGTAAGATPVTPETPPPPVIRQLAPALVQLGQTPATHSVTVALQPAELGRVEVHINRAIDGAATVQVTADRPETLRLLVADQPQLHRALDHAGLASEGRSLSFALSSPQTGTGPSTDGSGSGGYAAPRRQPSAGAPAGAAEDDNNETLGSSFVRAGVDITA